MKHLVTALALSLHFLFLAGCHSRQPSNYDTLRGKIAVQYTDERSSYHWNFTRTVTKKLTRLAETAYDDGRLLNLQINQHTLTALNYKESKFALFDTTLAPQQAPTRQLNNLVVGNRGLLFFDHYYDSLFIYNFNRRLLIRYHLAGRQQVYNRQLFDSAGIYRMGRLTGDKYLYTKPRDSMMDMHFVRYDAAAGKIDTAYSFNDLMPRHQKTEYPAMAYDGHFVSHPQSRFLVYYCSFAGVFFAFHKQDGTFAFQTSTIDQTPAPKAAYVAITPVNKSLEITPNIMFFTSACIFRNDLYLLNGINKEGDYAVDIYDLDNKGAYRETIFVPRSGGSEGPLSIAAQENRLFVLYKDQTIIKYAINHF